MKKILMALAASATALIAFATINTTEGFEGGDLGGFTGGGAPLAYEGVAPSFANYPFESAGSYCCDVDADGTDALTSPVAEGATYFDMYLQFPSNASEPTLDLEDDAKLAVYVNSASNVVVISGDANPTNVTDATVAPDTWARLTIAKVEDGFKVYVNGTAVNSGAVFAPIVNGDPSFAQFTGVGKLDNYVARTTDPFIQNPAVTIDGEGYASIDDARSDNPSATYQLEADATLSTPLEYGELISVKLNNHTLSGITTGLLVPVASTVGDDTTYRADYFPRTATPGQNGTNENPYEIADADDLQALQAAVAEDAPVAGQYKNYCYVQTADIDMGSAGAFAGIGAYAANPTGGTPFSGTYDGGNFKICNVDFTQRNYGGIFNQVNGGTIKNLTVSNITCSAYSASVNSGEFGFAIIGNAGNGAVLTNIVAEGVFASAEQPATHNIAGIVVRASAGGTGTLIKGCVNSATLHGAYTKAGGICAITQKGESGGVVAFEDCVNAGTISMYEAAVVDSSKHAGQDGLAGILGYVDCDTTIKDCANTGALSSTYATARVGQIVGWAYSKDGNSIRQLMDLGGNAAPSNAKMVDTISDWANVTGFKYATVDNGVATTIASPYTLAKDTTYLLEDNVGEGLVYTFYDAGTIAFDTALDYTFAGIVAANTSTLVLAGPVTEGTLTTYTASAGAASVDGVAYATFAEAVTALAGATDDFVTLLANAETTLATGETLKVKLGGHVLTVNKAADAILNDETVEGVTTFEAVKRAAYITKDGTTTNYASLSSAVAAATSGDTITLDKDTDENISLPTGVSFALNGHTYSGTVSAAAGNGYVVVENADTGVYSIVDNTASTWTGSVDSLWGTAGNWSTGLVPGQYTTVTFNNAADIGIGEGDDVRMVAGLVLNGNVSLHHNTRNYSYWPSVKICGGNVTGTGTLTLERCGFVGDGSGTINVACPVVFKGDSPANHDCFLQNGPIVFNGTVSSTTGLLHLQTPVTFNGAVNLTNATITSVVTSGKPPTFNGAVTLENGASILTYAFTYNDALTIGEGAVVSIGSSNQNYGENFTMTGSGRFIGNTVLPTGKAKEALTQSTWTGTFELLNKTVTDHWWISEYGNANSKVCFNNVTTYLYNDGNTGGSGNKNHMVAGIEVGSGGFKINGSYSKAYSWSLPALSGTGTFTVGIAGGTAGTHDKNVYLPADCSEFSGNIAFADDAANTRLVFGTTDREFKEKTICVGSDAVVGAGATWTASDEIYLDGIVKASANTSLSTVVGSGKIVYGAKPTGTHTFGEGWNGIGALDYKGDSRIDLADYVNTIAQKCSCDTVEVVDGCTMLLDNYLGANVTPTLKVSGFVTINDGSSTTKRTVSNVTGDGVLVFGTKGAMVNYAIDNVVGWNGVITNSASSTLVTNLVSGAGTVVYNVAASTTIGADFGGEVEYAVAPSAAPVVNAESEATVYLNFNYAGMNIAPYGNAKSTIKLGNLSADNAYLNDGNGSGTGRIPSKVIVAGDVTINNGWTQYPSFDWTGSKTLQFNEFTVDGSFVLLSTRAWNDAQCYYYIKSLNGDGAGSITVGAGYSLRIDAVDFAEAPSGDDCIVPLTVGAGTATAAAGNLYGADGAPNGPIPVTVNGVATEQSLVYNAEKGGLVLDVAPASVTITVPAVANTTVTVEVGGETIGTEAGNYDVEPDSVVTVTYAAAEGYQISGTTVYTIDTATATTFDPTGTTQVEQIVAYIGETPYTSLASAFSAVDEGDTLTLVGSAVTLADDVTVSASYTLAGDAEGTTVTGAGKIYLTGSAELTLDATLTSVGNQFWFISHDAKLTFPTGKSLSVRPYTAGGCQTGSIDNGDGTTTYYQFVQIQLSVGASHVSLAYYDSGETLVGPVQVNEGDEIVFTATPEEGYENPVVTVNGEPLAPVDGKYTVVVGTVNVAIQATATAIPPVAQVEHGETVTPYLTLAEAVAAAEAGDTIRLLGNLELDARVEPAKSMTIDLGGYTLSRTGTGGNGSVIDVKSGNVVITNGVIDCTQDDTAIAKDGVYAITARSGANVTLDTLTVTVDSECGACVYPFAGATVTILGGTYANRTSTPYRYKTAWTGMAVNQANVSTQLITIYGGSFKQVDPTLGDDSWTSAGNGFLASGYAATRNPSTGYYDVAEVQEVPVVPGQQTEPVDTEAEAEAIAEKTTVEIAPAVASELTTEQQSAYKDLFEAKVVEVPGETIKYAVAVELKDEVVAGLQEDIDDEKADVAAAAVAAAAAGTSGSGTADVATVPGLYYVVEAGTGLNDIQAVSCTLATGESTSLAIPNKGTSGFYKLRVSVTPVVVPAVSAGSGE